MLDHGHCQRPSVRRRLRGRGESRIFGFEPTQQNPPLLGVWRDHSDPSGRRQQRDRRRRASRAHGRAARVEADRADAGLVDETVGEVVMLKEVLADGERALVISQADEERVVRLAEPLLRQPLRAGDSLLLESRSGYVYERIPKAEVEELILEEVPDISYKDIGGLSGQIEQIRDAIELPYLHADLFKEHQLKPPKGVLLYGPPGTGKTLIAKAVANSLAKQVAAKTAQDEGTKEGKSFFLNIKGPELLNKYVGETERHIRLVFQRAREKASEGMPVIVFFDEMDSIFRTRGSGVSSDVENTIVPQLLSEIDGVEGLENVIVIGASNREDMIDPAILRPGRLDVKIKIERPDAEAARRFSAFPRRLRARASGWRHASVVQAFQVPRPVDPIEVDERQPFAPHDLEVIARDSPPPPLLLDPPAIAHLDRLAPAVPADRDEGAGVIQLDLDRRVAAQARGARDARTRLPAVIRACLETAVESREAGEEVADGLDRSHRQLVTDVACRVRSRRVEFEAVARGDCEAELEAARRKADLFERVFDRRTLFRAIPAGREEAVHQKDLEMISAEALWG